MKITKIYNKNKIFKIDDFKEGEFFIDIGDGEMFVKLEDKIESDGYIVNVYSITNKQTRLLTNEEELIPIEIEEIIYKVVV